MMKRYFLFTLFACLSLFGCEQSDLFDYTRLDGTWVVSYINNVELPTEQKYVRKFDSATLKEQVWSKVSHDDGSSTWSGDEHAYVAADKKIVVNNVETIIVSLTKDRFCFRTQSGKVYTAVRANNLYNAKLVAADWLTIKNGTQDILNKLIFYDDNTYLFHAVVNGEYVPNIQRDTYNIYGSLLVLQHIAAGTSTPVCEVWKIASYVVGNDAAKDEITCVQNSRDGHVVTWKLRKL